MRYRRRISIALLALIGLVVVGWLVQELPADTRPAPASQVPGAGSGLPVRQLSALPEEVAQTRRLIENGGPFRYPDKDGSVFGNREKRLPQQRSGYYHEYTVAGEGEPGRGPQRLVTGSRDELYYTPDHYKSFVVVDPDR